MSLWKNKVCLLIFDYLELRHVQRSMVLAYSLAYGEYKTRNICGKSNICPLPPLCTEDILGCQDWLLRPLNIMGEKTT